MRLSLIIVTYRREFLLGQLLDSLSIAKLPKDTQIVIVDNDGSAKGVADAFTGFPVHYIAPKTNLGGAGGFRLGAEHALELGADWCWLMDDDVEFLPEAFPLIEPFMSRFPALIGERRNFDGSLFYFRSRFSNWLGVPLSKPFINTERFEHEDHFETDVLSFEGALISRPVFDKIGLPDARFFITWDDAIFGYMAAKHFPVAIAKVETLKRTKEIPIGSIGIRPLHGLSDLSRYHVMRNRRIVREYFKKTGDYRPVGFFVGTWLVFAKEIVRLFIIERKVRGIGALARGLWDSFKEQP